MGRFWWSLYATHRYRDLEKPYEQTWQQQHKKLKNLKINGVMWRGVNEKNKRSRKMAVEKKYGQSGLAQEINLSALAFFM